jgi:alkylated DNA repair dioxygenase AlkB
VPDQLCLLGRGAPAIDARFARVQRHALDDSAWVEYAPGWVEGQDALFEALARDTRWRSERRHMYERMVDVPRLLAALPEDGPGHPLLADMQRALEERYGTAFPHITLGLYRGGDDSVAWHGDRVAREMPEAIVATVSLGEPRRFLLRPKGGGPARAFKLGWGDLIVMGGACQRTWQHSIPKTAFAHPRLVVMLRPSWALSPAFSAYQPRSGGREEAGNETPPPRE